MLIQLGLLFFMDIILEGATKIILDVNATKNLCELSGNRKIDVFMKY